MTRRRSSHENLDELALAASQIRSDRFEAVAMMPVQNGAAKGRHVCHAYLEFWTSTGQGPTECTVQGQSQ